MGKKTVKHNADGTITVWGSQGYEGKIATGGKTAPVSGPVIPQADAEDVDLDDVEDPTTVAYRVYTENQERLYNDMHAKRLADLKRQHAYYVTNPRMARSAEHTAREIAFLEEGRTVEYTAISEGTSIILRIKSIYTGDYARFELYGGAEERHDEILQKYLAKNGAYWSTMTEEDFAHTQETDAQLLRDTARWGSE